ncbi:putative wd repeat protein [Rosellinia necatrix]|uniref:Putative wd repeat protein n=1 Tax=Rosellinia necatrix TaxID=77044 RepID=A0A1W2TLU6_ROSNE|nr:putative wd repeat protein [Rosellinia necatrix]
MPYYETSQEWLRQSALLLEARPSTTRITTTYHLTDKTGTSKKRQKRRHQQHQEQQSATAAASSTSTTAAAAAAPTAPRASLTIKTYDPHSGACLKYRTTKAAEVSRLILSLGQLGRKMAALPADAADAVVADAAAAEEVGTPTVEKTEGSAGASGSAGAKGQAQVQQQAAPQQGGGGKGKKKRGKK